jgi:hypothetical protein
MVEQTADAGTGQVPHPLHAYVQALLTRVHTTQGRLHNKQSKPAAAISEGTAWVSTAATLWTGEFTPRATRYVSSVGSLDDALTGLLRSTPATCSKDEAARWRAKLGGKYGA